MWMKIACGTLILLNSLCLLRLGLLPMLFFGRNYSLYGKIFWISCLVALIFCLSEYMLIRIMIAQFHP